jgi:hypothetical protein
VKPIAVSLLAYVAIVVVALVLASGIVLLVLARWNRHDAPHHWKE